jgi:hypothetical protein
MIVLFDKDDELTKMIKKWAETWLEPQFEDEKEGEIS